jgi:hypothetical protein
MSSSVGTSYTCVEVLLVRSQSVLRDVLGRCTAAVYLRVDARGFGNVAGATTLRMVSCGLYEESQVNGRQ